MTRSRQLLLAAAVAILAAVAGFAAHLWRLTGDGGSADAIMALRLPDLAGHRLQQHVQRRVVDRLRQEVLRARLHRLDRRIHAGMRRDQDHRQGRIGRLEATQQVDARAARQHDVRHDDVRPPLVDARFRLLHILCRTGVIAPAAQAEEEHLPEGCLIVDDQNT